MPGFDARAGVIALLGAACFVLSAPATGIAEPTASKPPVYDVIVNEDEAAKACVLELLLEGSAVGEVVDSQLIVARIKLNDAFSGPLVFGFRIEAADLKFAKGRSSGARQIKINSAAFVSQAYTAVARPKTAPFADGSMVISTLDYAEGGKLVDAVTKGQFQVMFTRRQPAVARTYQVTLAPPADVRARFGDCIAAFALTE